MYEELQDHEDSVTRSTEDDSVSDENDEELETFSEVWEHSDDENAN